MCSVERKSPGIHWYEGHVVVETFLGDGVYGVIEGSLKILESFLLDAGFGGVEPVLVSIEPARLAEVVPDL